MEAARTSETSVDNHFTRQYNPEDSSEHHTRRRENLKSHIFVATSILGGLCSHSQPEDVPQCSKNKLAWHCALHPQLIKGTVFRKRDNQWGTASHLQNTFCHSSRRQSGSIRPHTLNSSFIDTPGVFLLLLREFFNFVSSLYEHGKNHTKKMSFKNTVNSSATIFIPRKQSVCHNILLTLPITFTQYLQSLCGWIRNEMTIYKDAVILIVQQVISDNAINS
jgi:hypothetical protein